MIRFQFSACSTLLACGLAATLLIGCGIVDRDISGPGAPTKTNKATPSPPTVTTPPTSPVGQICGVQGCVGRAEQVKSCRTDQAWWAGASAYCQQRGLEALYFELHQGSCAPGSGTSARYSCCPSGVATEELTPSSKGCPATVGEWPMGSACTAPLWCNYVNPCGDLVVWHCKAGWSPNSGCAPCDK